MAMIRLAMLLLFAAPVAFAAPVPKEDDAARMLRIYGTRADPKDDAKYEMKGDSLSVLSPACEVPPPEVPGVRPTPAQIALEKWKPNPPSSSRVWREVSGDFTATVRVSFRLRPAREPEGVWLPRAAGLVAWSGEKDHIGMMRCEELALDAAGEVRVREAFQNIFTHGLGIRTALGLPTDHADAGYVRLTRAGSALTGAYSHDGKKWTEFLADEVEWPQTVKVGVYVKHFTNAPFDVT